MIIIQRNIIPKWTITGHSDYIVSDDNEVYNLKSKKKLQMQLKGYTKGYYLNGKFKSLKVLRTILVKVKPIKCPF